MFEEMGFNEMFQAIHRSGVKYADLPSYGRCICLHDDLMAMNPIRRWLSFRMRREHDAAWAQLDCEMEQAVFGEGERGES